MDFTGETVMEKRMKEGGKSPRYCVLAAAERLGNCSSSQGRSPAQAPVHTVQPLAAPQETAP